MAQYPSDKKRDVGYKFSAGILSTDADFEWFGEKYGLSPNQLALDIWAQGVPFAASGGADAAISSHSYISKKDVVLVSEPNTNDTLWFARVGGTLSGNRMRNFINPNNHTNAAGNISLGYTVLAFQSSASGAAGTSITTTDGSWQFMYKEGAFITDDDFTPSDMSWNTTSTTSGEKILHATVYQYEGINFQPNNNPSATNNTLKYNNSSGYLEWGAGGSSGGISLSDINVGAEGTASGDGGISWNSSTGVLTYTPPLFSGLDDTNITSVSSGQFLSWDGTDWINVNAPTNGVNGDDGVSPVALMLSNPVHSLPTTAAGTVTYTGSGTDIKVYSGGTQLDYGSSTGKFEVSAAVTTGTVNTIGTASTVGGNIRRFGQHNNMTTNGATITYTITVHHSGGDQTYTALQSLSKQIAGTNGSDATVNVTNIENAFTNAGDKIDIGILPDTVKNDQVTKITLGISNVQDKSSATIRSEIIEGNIPALSASKITSGLFNIDQIPVIPAGKIGSPFNANKITHGTFDDARIPNLDGSKITTGTVDADRVDTLPASKISDFDTEVSNNANVAANTGKTGITATQASEITANTNKDGITTAQADAITANTGKVGITTSQSTAITTNTSKVGITTTQANEIAANTSKTGITSVQANAIAANTAKVSMSLGTGSGDALAGNTDVVTKTGTETITNKTFTSPIVNGAASGSAIGSNKQDVANGVTKVVTGDSVYQKANQDDWGVPEGTAIQSTGESGGAKFLREDGDGTCSWQTISSGGGGASELDDLSDVLITSTPSGGSLLQYDQTSSKFKPTKTLSLLTSISSASFFGTYKSDTNTHPSFSLSTITENIGGTNYKHGIIRTNADFIVQMDVQNIGQDVRSFRIMNPAGNTVFSVDETGGIKSGKFTDSSGNDKIEYETNVVKIHEDVKYVTGKIKDNADATRIDFSGTDTKISGNTQFTGSSPATLKGPDADKLNIESVDDLDFKIASAGASSKSFKFYNNTNEVAKIDNEGNFYLDKAINFNSAPGRIYDSGDNVTMFFGSDGSTTINNLIAGGLKSSADMVFQVDYDESSAAGANSFQFKNGAGTEIANLNESGDLQIDGDLTLSGLNLKNADGETSISVDANQNAIFNGNIRLLGNAIDNQAGSTCISLSNTGSTQLNSLELGNASDTTIARSAAGTVTIEGKEIVTKNKIYDFKVSAFFSTYTNTAYSIPFGGTLSETTSLTANSYSNIYPAPFDGRVVRIVSKEQRTTSGTSELELFLDASSTKTGSTISISSFTTKFEVDCPADWVFSKGETIAIKRKDTSSSFGTSMNIVFEFDATT